jgi:hypothetical protein
MKLIKIYLGIVTVLLILGIGFGIYVWYTVQKIDAEVGTVKKETPQAIVPSPVVDTNVSSKASTEITEPVVVKTADLTTTQQNMLKTFGYTQDTFTITPAMITCAENAVEGKARLEEIMKGAAPTPLESLKLLPCFK